jgi:hypothetical protein
VRDDGSDAGGSAPTLFGEELEAIMSLEVLERPVRDETVEASLLFLQPSGQRPRLDYTTGSSVGDVTEIYTPHTVTIRDAREIDASADVHGFELVRHESSIDFLHEDQIADIGRAEASSLLREATGAARVFVFDHTFRKRTPEAPRQPSVRVHVDYTERSAPRRLRDFLPEEAETLLKKRFAYFSVWRGVRHSVQDYPLVLGDARSFAASDLVATDVVYGDRTGEIYNVAYDPGQRWYYYPDLALDEVLLIKCYDSRKDIARFTPHTAFKNPLTPAGAPPRESIEFRAIAFFD